MLSTRIEGLRETPTIRTNRLATELRNKGETVYNFGVGEPDFTTPEEITRFAMESAMKGGTHYTPPNGIPELREALSQKFDKKNGILADPSRIIVTTTKFALNLSMLTLINPGDSVLIIEPFFPSYPDIIRFAGGKPVVVSAGDGFTLDLQEIGKAIDSSTKAIILCNPNNPTGTVYSEESIRGLSDLVINRGLYLVSDEIYEDLIFEGRMISPASLPGMEERTVTISGFSKSYAMTGWRIGYMTGPEDFIEGAGKLQQQTITCVSSVSQYAALKALQMEETITRMRESYRARRDLVMKLLSVSGRLKTVKPNGAFYVFPSYDMPVNSSDFSVSLLEKKHVAITPGIAFGPSYDHSFRISYATSNDVIETGIEKLNEFLSEL